MPSSWPRSSPRRKKFLHCTTSLETLNLSTSAWYVPGKVSAGYEYSAGNKHSLTFLELFLPKPLISAPSFVSATMLAGLNGVPGSNVLISYRCVVSIRSVFSLRAFWNNSLHLTAILSSVWSQVAIPSARLSGVARGKNGARSSKNPTVNSSVLSARMCSWKYCPANRDSMATKSRLRTRLGPSASCQLLHLRVLVFDVNWFDWSIH